jgi:adenylate cyclase class 2
MANKDVEIEIKLPLKNPEEVTAFLNAHAKVLAVNVSQKDSYFVPTHRTFLHCRYPFEWLRLRQSPKGASINYKHFHPENSREHDYCDEFETAVDNPAAMVKILKSLDFQEAVVVEKVRTTWLMNDVEVAIDEVRDLGTFIELEANGHFTNPREAKTHLFYVLKELKAKVGEEDLRGYPFRILEKQGHEFEKKE